MSLYPRYIAPALDAALSDTPVVCVLGPRQVGNTTLVQQLMPQRYYISFNIWGQSKDILTPAVR